MLVLVLVAVIALSGGWREAAAQQGPARNRAARSRSSCFVLDQAPPANDFTGSGEPEVLLPPAAHLTLTGEWRVS